MYVRYCSRMLGLIQSIFTAWPGIFLIKQCTTQQQQQQQQQQRKSLKLYFIFKIILQNERDTIR